jgi:hypothetical protein
MTRVHVFAGFIAIVEWFALALQFSLSYSLFVQSGNSPGAAIVQFFSYFTILSNLGIAVALTALPFSRKPNAWIGRPFVLTGLAIYILVVGWVYNIALRSIWNPQGWMRLADELLHSVLPLWYFLFWLLCVPKGSLSRGKAFSWLYFPLAYSVYAMIRGSLTGIYPYPFLDVGKLGLLQVLLNLILVLAVVLLFGAGLLWIDRRMGRTGKNLGSLKIASGGNNRG